MDEMQLVDDKIKEFDALYKRMDATKTRLEDAYTIKDYDGKKIAKAISVTLNTAAWQATVMADKLMKLEWQTKVESSTKLPKTRISAIERFSDDVWAQVDEFIADQHGLSGGLNSWNAKKVVTRGPIGARWYLRFDKQGHLIIACLPLDMRWCPFELNEWYCNITYRSAAQIQQEYGENIAVTGTDIEVRDFWDKDREQVFVGKEKVADEPNPYHAPPFVVVMTSAGFQFRDKQYIEHESESFDFLDRNLYDEANRSASIAQSLGMDSLLGGFEQETEDNPAKAPDMPPAPDESIRVKKGELHVRIPRGDLNNAFIEAAQSINQAISRGGVTDTEAGNNERQNTALWITTQNAILIEKLKPFQDALAAFKTKSMRMIIDQYIKLSERKRVREVDVGMMGITHRYSAAQLGDPSTYRITYVPMLNSKDQNIANIAEANAEKGILPLRFILENTIQVPDPDGVMRELELEKAKQLDPTIGLIEMALAYAEEAEELTGVDADVKNMESMNLTDSAVALLKQREIGIMPLPAKREESKPNQQGLLALGAGKINTPKAVKATVEAG